MLGRGAVRATATAAAAAAARRAGGRRSALLLTQQQQRAGRGQPLNCAAQFSTAPPAADKPTIFDGLDGLVQYYERCAARTDTFERYERLGLFLPSAPRFSTFFLFTKLQLPPETEIDAAEFLDGARFACDLAMNTMYSREFLNFACGAITESRAAASLKRGLSQECYDAFLFASVETSKSGNTFDLTQLDINGVYLVGVDWERLTLADYKAEQITAAKRAEQASDGDEDAPQTTSGASLDDAESDTALEIQPSDYQTMIQRMRLDVRLEMKEHLEVQTADGQDQTVARDSSAVWTFESLVTTPDDIDWKIVSVL